MTQDNYWTRLRGRRVTRRRLLRSASVAGVGAAGIALVGCGDDDDDDQQAAPAAAQQQQQAQQQAEPQAEQQAQQQAQQAAQQEQADEEAAAQVTPKRGGTINRAETSQQPHFDVHRASTSGLSSAGAGQMYNNIVKPKPFDHGGETIVQGSLAESWEIPEPTNLIFTIRQDAHWHDIPPLNGRLLTASDIDFSTTRQIGEGTNASAFAGLASQEVVDDFTFSMTLDQVNVDFLAGLTDSRNSVVSPEAVEAGGGSLEDGPPIGTGGWLFDEWTRDVSFRVVRNPNYHRGPELPYADATEVFSTRDPAQIQAQFLAGNFVQIGAEVLEEGTLADVRDDPEFRIVLSPVRANAMILVQLDGRFPYLLDPRVRQAISVSVDRDVILKNVFRDLGIWDATGMTLAGPNWRLPQEEIREVMAFNPQKAQELLDAAGADGAELPDLEVPVYSLGAGTLPMTEIIQQMWRAVGFDITIRPVDNVELVSLFTPAGADFAIMPTPILHSNTMTGDFEAWIKTDGVRNAGHVSDANIDRLINEQKAEFDETKRRELMNELQRAVVELASPIGITATGREAVVQTFVKNWDPPPGNGPHEHFEEVWLDL